MTDNLLSLRFFGTGVISCLPGIIIIVEKYYYDRETKGQKGGR